MRADSLQLQSAHSLTIYPLSLWTLVCGLFLGSCVLKPLDLSGKTCGDAGACPEPMVCVRLESNPSTPVCRRPCNESASEGACFTGQQCGDAGVCSAPMVCVQLASNPNASVCRRPCNEAAPEGPCFAGGPCGDAGTCSAPLECIRLASDPGAPTCRQRCATSVSEGECFLNDDGKPAGVFYVSNTGVDSNTGTLDRPFKTLLHAVPKLKPRDILYLRGGTYPESIETDDRRYVVSSGLSWKEPIVIAGMPGERPVMMPANTCYAIHLAQKFDQYMSFENLVIDGSRLCTDMGAGFKADGQVSNIRLLNVEVKSSPGVGVVLLGTEKVEVRGCEIHGNGTTTKCVSNDSNSCPQQLGVGGFSTLIEGNHVYDGPAIGIRVYASTTWPADTIVRGNRVHDVSKIYQSAGGIVVYNGTNALVSNNVIYRSRIGIGVAYDTCTNLRMYNNTLVDNKIAGISATNGVATQIVNNLFYLNRLNSSNTDGGWVVKANLELDESPFVDAASFDYHLTSNNPAKDVAETLEEVKNDFDGVRRPVGQGPDVGAYEALQ